MQSEVQTTTIPSGRMLLREAWARYRRRWRLFAGVMFFPFIGEVVYFIAVFFIHRDVSLADETTSFSLFLRILQTPETLVSFILFLVLSIWSAAALLFVSVKDEPLMVREAYREAGRFILSYLWITVLVGIITAAGFLLLIVPGILFTVWFSLALFIFAAEGVRGVNALRKSKEYVRGKWQSVAWRIVFISATLFIFSFFADLLEIIFTFLSGFFLVPLVGIKAGAAISVYGVIGVSILSSLVDTLLLTPLTVLYMSLVYGYVSPTAASGFSQRVQEVLPPSGSEYNQAGHDENHSSNRVKRRVIILIIIILIVASLATLGWFAIRKNPLVSLFRAPETPIDEVIIRGYGSVPSYLLQAAKSAIEQKIVVRVSIESPRPGFTEQSPYYNSARRQFDADGIWDTESGFADSVSTKRLIMIVDVDLYTELQPERPYVFSRTSPNVSVILISAYRFQKFSDTSDDSAPPELAASRIQKLALQTLGVSVALEGFSFESAEDISCVMYRGRILSELDKQGDDFCGKQKEKLKKYFVIERAGEQ